MIGLRILFITVACWMISVPCFAKRHIKLSECVESAEILSSVILPDRVAEGEYILSIMNSKYEVCGRFSTY